MPESLRTKPRAGLPSLPPGSKEREIGLAGLIIICRRTAGTHKGGDVGHSFLPPWEGALSAPAERVLEAPPERRAGVGVREPQGAAHASHSVNENRGKAPAGQGVYLAWSPEEEPQQKAWYI
ncbi:hypothetical protein NDU88_006235 [Pleurodeles waltl]|uniref:Uncharacterized protein n=1 Tax=Pleurodeles waltl TaxID=8319 RepID=A0AAV7RPA3_PLEWA|nr:hypothetical protein NDU88_006235 [Pleurodeles waltl]